MVDKRVVIPDDMGAGLKFENSKWNVNVGRGLTVNQTTNQVEIKTGGGSGGTGDGNSTGIGVDSNGRLTVLRSSDAGNLLELRKNGLYYGLYPIQSEFYVDSTEGNDNNDGATPETPMKSMQKAVESMVNGPYTYYLYLRCSKTFEMPFFGGLTNITGLNILPYGPETSMFPSGIPGNPIYDGHLDRNYPRPTVAVRVRNRNFKGYDVVARDSLYDMNNAYVKFSGIKIIIDVGLPADDDGSKQGVLYGFISSNTVEFNGCDISIRGSVPDTSNWNYPTRSDALLRCINILFGSCKLANKYKDMGCVGYINTSLISVYDRGEHFDPNGVYPTINKFTADEILPNLPLSDLRQQGIYDINTKTLFGFTTNWDCFQYLT